MTLDWDADQTRMMKAYGQKTDVVDSDQATMYLRLMVEEMAETLVAANPAAEDSIKALASVLAKYCRVADDHDAVEMLDGAIDVHVVTLGFARSMNFPVKQAWDVVFETNLAKVDPATGKVRRREDGKVLKPDGWQSPTEALARLLLEWKTGVVEYVGGLPLPNTLPDVRLDIPTGTAQLTLSERYLNLAGIYLGEAITEMNNTRQRGGKPGPDYINVLFALRRATCALEGRPYDPLPNDPKHSQRDPTFTQRTGVKTE